MHRVEVRVAIVGVLIRSHPIGRALEAHAGFTPGALYFETPIYPHHRHPARFLSAEPASRLHHVLLEIFVRLANLEYVLALYSFMRSFLAREISTLQALQ